MSAEIKNRTVYMLCRTDKPEDGTDIYVGSTSQRLKSRLRLHKANAKFCDSKLYKRIREVGIYNWKIIPLITFMCNINIIREFEREWVTATGADLNTYLPIRNNYMEVCRQSDKERYNSNIENKVYHCNICDKSFGYKYNLQRHFHSLKHQNEKVNSFEFEQLLTNVQEMIKNGTFLQALVNSRETYL